MKRPVLALTVGCVAATIVWFVIPDGPITVGLLGPAFVLYGWLGIRGGDEMPNLLALMLLSAVVYAVACWLLLMAIAILRKYKNKSA